MSSSVRRIRPPATRSTSSRDTRQTLGPPRFRAPRGPRAARRRPLAIGRRTWRSLTPSLSAACSVVSVLADEYLQTDVNGRVQDKKAWLDEYYKPLSRKMRSGEFRWDAFARSDMKTRVFNDVVVVIGTQSIRPVGEGIQGALGAIRQAANPEIYACMGKAWHGVEAGHRSLCIVGRAGECPVAVAVTRSKKCPPRSRTNRIAGPDS